LLINYRNEKLNGRGKMGNKVARCSIETGISEGRMQWERNGKEWQGKDKSAWEIREEDTGR